MYHSLLRVYPHSTPTNLITQSFQLPDIFEPSDNEFLTHIFNDSYPLSILELGYYLLRILGNGSEGAESIFEPEWVN